MSNGQEFSLNFWDDYPSEFVLADLIHEVYQPIQTIKGFSQALLKINFSEEERIEALNIILEKAIYLEHVIETARGYKNKLHSRDINLVMEDISASIDNSIDIPSREVRLLVTYAMPSELWEDVKVLLQELASLYSHKASDSEIFFCPKVGLTREAYQNIAEEYRKDQSTLLELAKMIQTELKRVNEINQKDVELTLDYKMSDKIWSNCLTLLRRSTNNWSKTEENRKYTTILRRFIKIVAFELNRQLLNPA